jgi:hypothetical protein
MHGPANIKSRISPVYVILTIGDIAPSYSICTGSVFWKEPVGHCYSGKLCTCAGYCAISISLYVTSGESPNRCSWNLIFKRFATFFSTLFWFWLKLYTCLGFFTRKCKSVLPVHVKHNSAFYQSKTSSKQKLKRKVKHAVFLQYSCGDRNSVMCQILYTVCTFSNLVIVKISVLQPLNVTSIEQWHLSLQLRLL